MAGGGTPTRRAGGDRRVSDGGDLLVRLNIVGTLVFVATSITAAVLFTSGAQWVGAVTALTLFLVGIAAFVWSFWNAVQRSRGEQVAVTQLYFLSGGVAPAPVRRLMLSLLAVQSVVGLATALARPNQTDGSPGTSLALGVLVPVFGFGLNGLWAAFHGRFEERDDDEVRAARAGTSSASSATRATKIDKNGHHG